MILSGCKRDLFEILRLQWMMPPICLTMIVFVIGSSPKRARNSLSCHDVVTEMISEVNISKVLQVNFFSQFRRCASKMESVPNAALADDLEEDMTIVGNQSENEPVEESKEESKEEEDVPASPITEESDVNEDDRAPDGARSKESVDLSAPAVPKWNRNSRRNSLDLNRMNAVRQNNLFRGAMFLEENDAQQLDVLRDNLMTSNGIGLGKESFPRTLFANQVVTLNGEPIKILKKPSRVTNDFLSPKRWNRNERASLPKDVYDIFWKHASGCVLAKSNKLSHITIKPDDDKLLFSIKNLQIQLKTIREHCHSCDIVEVFTIVVPTDVHNSSQILKETYDLFRDYATLHPAMVANSNAWCNAWVAEPTIRENLKITFEMLRNNTDAELWSKAYEDHEEFNPVQQGGPLMLFFILKRIIDVSESSITGLQQRIKTLKLTDLPGENVDEAVSLIKSALRVLEQCSTEIRNYVPDDLPLYVLRVFQTSTQPRFNEIFAREEHDARTAADKHGGRPKYPSVPVTLTLATNSHNRFTGPGDDYEWCKPVAQGSAFQAVAPGGTRSTNRCFNCNQEGCYPKICKLPLDQERIAKNRERYLATKKNSRGHGNGGRPTDRTKFRTKRDEHGRPLKMNKLGSYVVDTAKHNAERNEKLLAEKEKLLAAMTPKLDALTAAVNDSPSDQGFVSDIREVRELMRARLQN